MHIAKWVARRDEKWWWCDFAIFLFTNPRDSISLGNAFTSERGRRNRAGISEAVDYQDRTMPFHARCRISIKKSPLHITARVFDTLYCIERHCNRVLEFRWKICIKLTLRRKWKSRGTFYSIYLILYFLSYWIQIYRKEKYTNSSQ